MQGEYEVIYLTGAPASGKSTLLRALADATVPLVSFSYSKALAEHLEQQGESLSETDIRARSGTVVTPEDVAAVDRALLEMVAQKRSRSHIVIDSHAVTKERYGLRVTPFDRATLRAIAPTIVVCLYTPPEVVLERIQRQPQGRPLPSLFEAGLHTTLQCSVALNYALELGTTAYFFDSTRPVEVLVSDIKDRISKAR